MGQASLLRPADGALWTLLPSTLRLGFLHLAISRGFRVGLYCSDVAGAFDRVPSERLLSKLRAKGVHPKILKLLEDWLASRCALVIVDGQASKPLTLSNSVFQGTVLGPPLWNVFYEDCNVAIRSEHFKETVFADDCNCYRFFANAVSDVTIFNAMRTCQTNLHEWGLANQASFDASKESFHILFW